MATCRQADQADFYMQGVGMSVCTASVAGGGRSFSNRTRLHRFGAPPPTPPCGMRPGWVCKSVVSWWREVLLEQDNALTGLAHTPITLWDEAWVAGQGPALQSASPRHGPLHPCTSRAVGTVYTHRRK